MYFYRREEATRNRCGHASSLKSRSTMKSVVGAKRGRGRLTKQIRSKTLQSMIYHQSITYAAISGGIRR